MSKLGQAVYNMGGPKRTFLLGTVEGVKVLGVLIIFQIHFNRLGMEHIIHMISNCHRLGFFYKTRQQLD